MILLQSLINVFVAFIQNPLFYIEMTKLDTIHMPIKHAKFTCQQDGSVYLTR